MGGGREGGSATSKVQLFALILSALKDLREERKKTGATLHWRAKKKFGKYGKKETSLKIDGL